MDWGGIMTVVSAAIQNLKKSGSPLHAKDFASHMIAEGLWKLDGKTHAATVSARLYSDIKNNGDKFPFERAVHRFLRLGILP